MRGRMGYGRFLRHSGGLRFFASRGYALARFIRRLELCPGGNTSRTVSSPSPISCRCHSCRRCTTSNSPRSRENLARTLCPPDEALSGIGEGLKTQTVLYLSDGPAVQRFPKTGRMRLMAWSALFAGAAAPGPALV